MLSPEELEIESLYLSMSPDPEVNKMLYSWLANELDVIVNELRAGGCENVSGAEVLTHVENFSLSFRQISDL